MHRSIPGPCTCLSCRVTGNILLTMHVQKITVQGVDQCISRENEPFGHLLSPGWMHRRRRNRTPPLLVLILLCVVPLLDVFCCAISMSSATTTPTAPTAAGVATTTTTTTTAQATASSWLVRQLRQTKSVAECMQLVPENPTQDVVIAALHICGKHNDLGTAIELMKRHPSDASLSLTISIAGKSGDYQKALQLLHSSTSPSIASYHACLAACGKAKAWRDCLDLYERLDPANRTACTAGIVLTAMSKSNRGLEALDFFHSLPESRRDVQAVLKTMTALIGM
jgi:hypothetical protein